MGVNFWIQFIIQVIIAIYAVTYLLKLEREIPTETINPATEEETDINKL